VVVGALEGGEGEVVSVVDVEGKSRLAGGGGRAGGALLFSGVGPATPPSN